MYNMLNISYYFIVFFSEWKHVCFLNFDLYQCATQFFFYIYINQTITIIKSYKESSSYGLGAGTYLPKDLIMFMAFQNN